MTAGGSAPTRRLLPALALLAGSLGYMMLAVSDGGDRLAPTFPSLAEKVPGAFAVRALPQRVMESLSAGQVDQALKDARQLVSRAPIEADSASSLGMAFSAAGDDARADPAFRVSAMGGWRTISTQLYWLQKAAAAGDYPRAAERFDALVRQSPNWIDERSVIDIIERTPEGRAALADRLIQRPEWLTEYTRRVGDLPLDRMLLRADVIERLPRAMSLGCMGIAQPVNRLIVLGNVGKAADLWQRHCPTAGPGPVWDAQFKGLSLDPPLTPFNWMLTTSGDIGASIEAADRGARALLVDNSASVAKLVLAQASPIPAGRYTLRWTATDASGQPSDRIRAVLSCTPEELPVNSAEQGPTKGTWAMAVEATAGCKLQWLKFSVAAGTGAVRLSDIRLERKR